MLSATPKESNVVRLDFMASKLAPKDPIIGKPLLNNPLSAKPMVPSYSTLQNIFLRRMTMGHRARNRKINKYIFDIAATFYQYIL